MTEQQTAPAEDAPLPTCPKCDGPMWDNREGKRNPKAPDFKCKDRECDGVIWPPREAVAAAVAAAPAAKPGEATVNDSGLPNCPTCGGPMWDDRLTKRNPKAPDFKCRNKPKERGGPGCEGIIWPPRAGQASVYPPPVPRAPRAQSGPPINDAPPHDAPPPFDEPPPFDDDDLPF